MISCLIFLDPGSLGRFQYITAGALIIFFLGFKDDIIGTSPAKKFLVQIIASLIVIILGDIRFTSLHGFLGIYGISALAGISLTLVTMVGITNCFNLMDGIDGLSGGLGVIASVSFGLYFYSAGDYRWSVMMASITGALVSFLYFNVFADRYKIFMGDTGSLVLGFLLAVTAVKFNETVLSAPAGLSMAAAPAVSIGILIIPIFDTLRVAVTRLINLRSPFMPDKTHIHHYLLELIHSHRLSSLVLILAAFLFCLVSYCLRNTPVSLLLVILIAMAAVLFYIPIYLVNKRKPASDNKSKKSPLSP